MYIGVTKWTNEDGTVRRRESYICSYASKHRGTNICKRNGIVAEVVENEVMEFTKKLVCNSKFAQDIEYKIGSAIDLSEIDKEIDCLQSYLIKLKRKRSNLERDIDNIDDEDIYFSRRREDMAKRLDGVYTEIYRTEDALQEVTTKKETIQQEKLNIKTIYAMLSSFDKIYDKMSKEERRSMMKYLVSDIQLYMPDERKKIGRCCKSITYRFPIEQSVLQEFSDNGVQVETVAQLVRMK